MEGITIILETIFDSIVSLVHSITLVEFCLLAGLVLLATISRRLGFIHKAIRETKYTTEEIRDVLVPLPLEDTEPQGEAEPQEKIDPQEKIYPQM
jgi:hypothetical protein